MRDKTKIIWKSKIHKDYRSSGYLLIGLAVVFQLLFFFTAFLFSTFIPLAETALEKILAIEGIMVFLIVMGVINLIMAWIGVQ